MDSALKRLLEFFKFTHRLHTTERVARIPGTDRRANVMDPANIYLEDGKLWREMRVTLPMLLDYKQGKVDVDDTVAKLFQSLVAEMRRREPKLFFQSGSPVEME